MVVTLKDGSVVTLFDSKEAIDIIGQELYDFILNTEEKENILEEQIYEKKCEIDDLEDEVDYLENAISNVNNILDEAVDKLKSYITNLDEENEELNSILELIEQAYEITE